MKFGRKRPEIRAKLALRDYLSIDLPNPPDDLDYSGPAMPCLIDALGNDALGNCTSAGLAHLGAVWRANANNGERFANRDDAVGFYSRSAGYDGTPATDQGADEISVLNFAMQHGYFADGSGKIAGYVAVNGADWLEVRRALWLGEGLYFGCELPDAWVHGQRLANGFRWDVAGPANPANGHCFVGVGYRANGTVIVDSWGLIGSMTASAVAEYAASSFSGELYMIVSEDSINRATKKAPNGFDTETLLDDLRAVWG